MEQGLVSVIVPVYNRAHYVGATIDSILQQSYSNIEIVLVNDGSTDTSLEVLQEYQKQHPAKVVIIDQKNQGQVASRNNAIRQAKGEFIAFLDSDDLWKPEKLALQIPLFKDDIGLVYTGIDNIDEHGKVVSTELCDESIVGNILPQLLIRNRMTGGTVVVTKKALNEVGLFDESFSAAENWDLWIRICYQYKAALVNQALVQYRVHPGNMSKDRTLMLSAKEDIVAKHCNEKTENTELAKHYNKAKADLAYWKGVYYFSEMNYPLARQYFYEAHKRIPLYEDSMVRIMRSFLGKPGNKLIAAIKKMVKP